MYKTSIGNNFSSIEDTTVKFACSMGVFGYGGLNGVTANFFT